MTQPPDPLRYLLAISELAYLGADDDGPLSISDDPDASRAAMRGLLLDIHGDIDVSAFPAPDGHMECAVRLLRNAVEDMRDRSDPRRRRLERVVASLDAMLAQGPNRPVEPRRE